MSPLYRICPLLFLLMGTTAGAQGFSIDITPTQQSVDDGEQATFTISAEPTGGFSASIYLRVIAPSIPSAKVLLDPPNINAPYAPGATLVIAPNGINLGTHTIIIEGKNAGLVDYDTVSLTIRAVPGADQWQVYTTQNSGLPAMEVTAVEFDKGGRAWIGTISGLAEASVGEAPRRVARLSDTIHAIAVDSSNRVWVASGSRLWQYWNGEWFEYPLPSGIQAFRSGIRSIVAAPDSSLWFGTNAGVVRHELIEENAWRVYTSDDWGGIIGSRVHDMAVASNGDLWVSTNGETRDAAGVVMFDGSFWTTYSLNQLKLHEHTAATQLAVGDSDRVWIFNWDGMASARGSLLTYDMKGGYAIGTARNGQRWVASHPAWSDPVMLSAENGNTWKPYPLTKLDLVGKPWIRQIAVHNDGSVWMGTREHGLMVLRPGSGTAGVAGRDRAGSSDRFSVSPNPLASSATIALSTPGGSTRITLHDNSGRHIAILFEGTIQRGAQALPIDLAAVDSGAYLLRLEIDGRNVSSRMVVVAR